MPGASRPAGEGLERNRYSYHPLHFNRERQAVVPGARGVRLGQPPDAPG